MQEFINTFHIDWKLMIAQLFNFGIVFLAFYLLAAKPLRKLMNERGDLISKGVHDAKTNAEVLEKTKQEYQDVLTKARIEANKIFQDGRKDLEKIRAENIERIKKDEAENLKNRIAQMEIDKKALVESAKKEVISLAELAAEKIMDNRKK